jgi:hypothetical protein
VNIGPNPDNILNKKIDGINPASLEPFKTKKTGKISEESNETMPRIVDSISIDPETIKKAKIREFTNLSKEKIAKLDPNSPTFKQDARKILVDAALNMGFGSKISQDPGYPQMVDVISRKISLNEYADSKVNAFTDMVGNQE